MVPPELLPELELLLELLLLELLLELLLLDAPDELELLAAPEEAAPPDEVVSSPSSSPSDEQAAKDAVPRTMANEVMATRSFFIAGS